MLKFSNNSCYTDTLLTILFKSLSSFWRDNILTKLYNPSDFDKLICKTQVKNPSEVSLYSNRLKLELVYIYANLMKGNDITCSIIRPIFNECLGDLFINGQWVTYSPDIIYGLLTDLYPALRLNNLYEYHFDINVQKISHFTMWEFMEESNSKKIRWDLLDDKVLVFHNSGIPAITIYNEKGIEKNVINYDKTKVVSEIYKNNSFSEFILNDKYLLIGVITLQGYILGQDGGSHYVGYYRNREGKWVYYDDTQVSEKKIDKLPEIGVWKYSNYNLPYMYFYQRTDKIKNEILQEIKNLPNQKIEIPNLNITNQFRDNMNTTNFYNIIIPTMNSSTQVQTNPPIINIARVQNQTPIINIHDLMNSPSRFQNSVPIIIIPTLQNQSITIPTLQNQSINIPTVQNQPPIINIPDIMNSTSRLQNFVSTMNSITQQEPLINSYNVINPTLINDSLQTPSRITIQNDPIFPSIMPINNQSNILSIFDHFSNDADNIFVPSVLYSFNVNNQEEIGSIISSVVPSYKISDEDLPTRQLISKQNNIIRTSNNKKITNGVILLPEGNTIIKQEPEKVFSIRPYESLSYKYDIGHNRNDILEKVDIKKLLKGKKSAKNEGYKLDELQSFAKLLGIKINQSKDELVDAIKLLKNR